MIKIILNDNGIEKEVYKDGSVIVYGVLERTGSQPGCHVGVIGASDSLEVLGILKSIDIRVTRMCESVDKCL